MTNRIGIFGGTFNPIHLGHLLLAQSALEAHELAEVLFVPCCVPPHKASPSLASAQHRLAMVELAVEDAPAFEASDLDIRRGGPSYAIETLRTLHEERPDAEFVFIVGCDTLLELHLWRDVYSLLPLCRFAAFDRPGVRVEDLTEERIRLDPPWPRRLIEWARPGRLVDISSSDIRHRLSEGMSVRYLVPSAVEMYIAEHGLYGTGRPV